MSNIDDLKAKVERLRNQLNAAEKSYGDALKAAYPIQPGQIFTREGQRGQVVRLNRRNDSVDSVLRLFKKDGTLGERETTMWRSDWKEET